MEILDQLMFDVPGTQIEKLIRVVENKHSSMIKLNNLSKY